MSFQGKAVHQPRTASGFSQKTVVILIVLLLALVGASALVQQAQSGIRSAAASISAAVKPAPVVPGLCTMDGKHYADIIDQGCGYGPGMTDVWEQIVQQPAVLHVKGHQLIRRLGPEEDLDAFEGPTFYPAIYSTEPNHYPYVYKVTGDDQRAEVVSRDVKGHQVVLGFPESVTGYVITFTYPGYYRTVLYFDP